MSAGITTDTPRNVAHAQQGFFAGGQAGPAYYFAGGSPAVSRSIVRAFREMLASAKYEGSTKKEEAFRPREKGGARHNKGRRAFLFFRVGELLANTKLVV